MATVNRVLWNILSVVFWWSILITIVCLVMSGKLKNHDRYKHIDVNDTIKIQIRRAR